MCTTRVTFRIRGTLTCRMGWLTGGSCADTDNGGKSSVAAIHPLAVAIAHEMTGIMTSTGEFTIFLRLERNLYEGMGTRLERGYWTLNLMYATAWIWCFRARAFDIQFPFISTM